MSTPATIYGTITILNVGFTINPFGAGTVDVTFYVRGEHDLPNRNTLVGTFPADESGNFIPPVVIGGLTPGKYYIVRAECCGCVFEELMFCPIEFPPVAPGTITGNTNTCPGLPLQTYYIAAVQGAVRYDWTVPAGWVITSGQGTTSIEVTTGTTGGDITVVAVNSGGASPVTTFAVVVGATLPPLSQISGQPNPIIGVVLQYSVTPPDPTLVYNWSVPLHWQITAGQGTSIITVLVGNGGGNVSVYVAGPCNTVTATLPVTALAPPPPQPGNITGPTQVCVEDAVASTWSVTPVPGAVSYIWTIPAVWGKTVGNSNSISIANIPDYLTNGVSATETISVQAVNATGGISAPRSISVVVGICVQWVEGDTVCEDDGVVTLLQTFANFSSPMMIFYDGDGKNLAGAAYTGNHKCYVVDQDNAGGNLYSFIPASFTGIGGAGAAGITVIDLVTALGVPLSDDIYAAAADTKYRRVYLCGKNSMGLIIMELKEVSPGVITENIRRVFFGDQVPPQHDFNRTNINVMSATIICPDLYAKTITILDRALPVGVVGTVLDIGTKTSPGDIPFGYIYMGGNHSMTEVGGDIWVNLGIGQVDYAAPPATPAEIGIYRNDLLQLKAKIVITGSVPLPSTGGWGGPKYYGSSFYDSEKHIFYYGDVGSSIVTVINTLNRTIIKQIAFTNRQGKAYTLFAWTMDPTTHNLYMGCEGLNTPGDTRTFREYRIDRDKQILDYVFPGQNFVSLTTQERALNLLWGVTGGTVRWQDNPAGTAPDWNTDGFITKYKH